MATNELKAAIEKVRYVRDSHFAPDADLTTGDLATVIQLAEIGRLAVEARRQSVAPSVILQEWKDSVDASNVAIDAFLAARKGGK